MPLVLFRYAVSFAHYSDLSYINKVLNINLRMDKQGRIEHSLKNNEQYNIPSRNVVLFTLVIVSIPTKGYIGFPNNNTVLALMLLIVFFIAKMIITSIKHVD